MSKERDDDGGGLPERQHSTEHPGTAGSPGAPGRSGAPEHPGEPERAARRPRLVVAAVAAAVLVAGGGGAWWAAAANGGGGDKAAAPAPLRMDGPGLSGPVTGGGPDAGAGGAYRLTGKLPAGPDKAAVYHASGSISQADVQRLASLLGVSGPVTSDQGSWRVGGTTDGGGPSLLVSKAAPGTWSFTKYGPPSTGARPDTSSGTAKPGAGASGGSTTDGVPPSPGTTSSASGPGSVSGSGTSSATGSGPGADSSAQPVSAAKAEAVAKPVLDGLGLSGAAVDASLAVGPVRTVTADPRVGGLPTHGWGTSLQIGADGTVAFGYGRLADLAKGDTYPVVSAAAALKELNAVPRMHPDLGPSSCRVPLTGANGGAVTRSEPSPTTTPPGQDKTLPRSVPCVPTTGGSIQVRGAAFGLALEYVAGVQTLVPAWLFDTASAGVARTAVVAQAAVSPSYVQGGGAPSSPPVTPAPGQVNPGGPVQPPRTDGPPNARSPHRVAVDGYTAAGSTLTLTYSGGLCDTYAASASENGSTVKVSVVATPKRAGAMCPMIIRSFTAKVTLDHPLGSRTVLDASDGQPLKGQ